MDQGGPFSRRDWIDAVNLSALLGPLIIAAFSLSTYDVRAIDADLFTLLSMGLIAFLVAFPVCWAFGGPVLACLMRRPIGWLRAAFWGGVISAVMAGAFLGALDLLAPFVLQEIGDPGHDGDRGLLWAAGALDPPVRLQDIAQGAGGFIAVGVATALIVRAIIGPGRGSGDAC